MSKLIKISFITKHLNINLSTSYIFTMGSEFSDLIDPLHPKKTLLEFWNRVWYYTTRTAKLESTNINVSIIYHIQLIFIFIFFLIFFLVEDGYIQTAKMLLTFLYFTLISSLKLNKKWFIELDLKKKNVSCCNWINSARKCGRWRAQF